MNVRRAEWASQPFDSFDLETTGVNVEDDRVVTATVVKVDPTQRGIKPVQLEWLVNPGVEIPERATEVHGITTEKAREGGRDPETALLEIRSALYECWDSGRVMAGYNMPYDLTLLDRELRRYGLKPLGEPGPCVDGLVLDKQLFPRLRGTGARRLTTACRRYKVMLAEAEAHTSAGDALAAARVVYMQAAYPEIRVLTVPQLHDQQKEWFREQQISFAGWLETRNPPEAEVMRRNAPYGWPILPWEHRPVNDPIVPEAQDDEPPF